MTKLNLNMNRECRDGACVRSSYWFFFFDQIDSGMLRIIRVGHKCFCLHFIIRAELLIFGNIFDYCLFCHMSQYYSLNLMLDGERYEEAATFTHELLCRTPDT